MIHIGKLLGDLEPAFAAVAWRGFAWLVVVVLLLFCSRKMSAAVRHWIGFCGMAGLLLVTILGGTDVRWKIVSPVPPVAQAGESTMSVEPVINPMTVSPGFAEVIDPAIGGISVGPVESALSRQPIVAPDLTEAMSPVIQASAQSPQPLPWLMMLWVPGALFVGARLMHSAWLLRQLRRGSSAAPAAVDELALRLQEQLGFRASVAIRLADRPVAPMAVGIFSRCILLPQAAATDWSQSRLRAVLLHEFSHLRRRDILTGAIGMVAAGVHWFNPLAWLVYQRMLNDREVACDDAVIAAGMLPSDYASHLLEIGAGNPANRPPLTALAMARSNAVEERIKTILEPGIHRHRLHPSTGWLVTVVGLFAAGSIGSLQFLSAEPDRIASIGLDIAGPLTFQNAEHEGVAMASKDGGSGRLHLVDLADNTIRWSIETKFPPHDRPLLSDDHVLLMTSDRTLHSYSIQDGEELWSYETDAEDEFFLDSVLENSTSNSTVILATLGGGMIALSTTTGQREISPLIDGEKSGHFPNQGTGGLLDRAEAVPPQFMRAYLVERPTGFINDPQHLLPKEARIELTESLRNWCAIRGRDVQIMILDGNQNYPEWAIGGPSNFNLWTDGGTGRLIVAYFLGNQRRLLSWPQSVRVLPAGVGPPSFELAKFIERLDGTASDLGPTDLDWITGDSTFSKTENWDVIAQGGGAVVPARQFASVATEGESEDDQPLIKDVVASNDSDWVVFKGTLSSSSSGGMTIQRESSGEMRILVPVVVSDIDRVTEILVKTGDRVQPGSPLVRLDGRAAAVKIRNASVDFEAAESALEAADLDDADRQRLIRKVESSRKRLETAAAELAGKTVRSTVFGKVLDVNAVVGKSVSPLHPIVEIEKRAYLD